MTGDCPLEQHRHVTDAEDRTLGDQAAEGECVEPPVAWCRGSDQFYLAFFARQVEQLNSTYLHGVPHEHGHSQPLRAAWSEQ